MANKSEVEMLPLLTGKEAKFVAHYVVHFNGAAAVREAGYEATQPRTYAVELLAKPSIQAHVEAKRKEIGQLHFDLANRATAKLCSMMEADRTAIYDAEGNVLDPREWPEDCKLLIAGIETEEHMTGEGDAAMMVRTKKVKLEAPKGVIDSILKITGQIVDRTQFLDRHGRPTDPASVRAVIELTVGERPKGTK